ncbi:serine-threonine protein kinase [Streptomyces sp. G-G2]|uniref:serine-threonine protein kinase n=1 Tax=Streptomyces sp. G-G2 TaxID=3046201 RepID=UPI0024B963E4|nr:serine-threonine protein kinase [Streptomyces sp. G-G2]MDJ0381568.1 serine-threonine protein kinase [Streptomyces sp. G-G2]
MGVAGIGVRPYVELTFDAEGDVDPATRDAVAALDVTDLLVFAHGWNSDRTAATQLYDHFFAPFPGLLGAGVRPGYVGVVWPSMRFSDEPIPDFGHQAVAGAVDAAGYGVPLDPATRRALGEFWPGREAELDRLAQLLDEQPESAVAFIEFGALVRELSGTDAAVSEAAAAPGSTPLMFTADVLEVCRAFTDALVETGAPLVSGARGLSVGSGLHSLWNGAKELLRQATYYQMKKRAGVVGERGLGPVLTGLARPAGGGPGPRVHLIGHSFGARVVSYALRGVPADGQRFVRSATLLQGAFSHYAFTGRLPFDTDSAGPLHGLEDRVAGPVVACHSDFDTALKVLYPLASRMAGDATGFAGFDARWGAVGHDGLQLPGTPRLSLDAALRGGLPTAGCVSVDAASVVRRGGPPSGAHSDVCHPELARLVTLAGRIGR